MLRELLAVVFITVLAVISPGPDFAIITRTSYAYGARSGLIPALGIAGGGWAVKAVVIVARSAGGKGCGAMPRAMKTPPVAL